MWLIVEEILVVKVVTLKMVYTVCYVNKTWIMGALPKLLSWCHFFKSSSDIWESIMGHTKY